ncbi:ABC transporter ATP-binding protein [Halospina sp. K52047b]|uniref:ABC transporter ATP-binding protein n=1 Tax=Halospina sp. K52047b TaxID=2614160 RepID=UPI00124A8C3E|nr:ABC transporter ATP-binding protein [Halospina sp. K52047b]KAA8983438.1 ABC transporter ATP-binding protein [Halospina sp. K52047b]
MTDTAIDLQGLHKTYKGGQPALAGVDLSVPRGAFHGLLGPNGAGKSTLIGLMTGLVRLETGSVRLFGHDPERDPVAARRRVGLVPQEVNFNSFEPINEIIETQAMYYGLPRRRARERARVVLERVGLQERAERKPWGLSGGMKRRLMLARALVHEPELLILDEPTAGLDVEARRDTWALLQELNMAGTTILMSSHYLEEMRDLCQTVAVLKEGRLIANDIPERLFGADAGSGTGDQGLEARFLRLLEGGEPKGEDQP